MPFVTGELGRMATSPTHSYTEGSQHNGTGASASDAVHNIGLKRWRLGSLGMHIGGWWKLHK